MEVTCIIDDRVPSDSGLRAEHGASFAIRSGEHTVLFDTGTSAKVLLGNLSRLGFSPEQIDALILSHAHNDHTGGLAGLLERVQGIPCYAHPDLFRERYRETKSGHKQVGPSSTENWLAKRTDLRFNAEPVEVVPGLWTTGEITDRSHPEGRSPRHAVRQGADWIPDPYRDDLSVVLKTGDGLVLVCGCCHAGLLNVLAQVRQTFGQDPIAVIGGIHLTSADAPTLEQVVAELRRFGPPHLWLGHCTGDRAYQTLKNEFGDRVSPCQAGTVIQFSPGA